MLLQFSQSSPSVEVRNGNENTSDASRASKLSSNVPGDLSLACFADAIFSVRLFGGNWNLASAEFRVRFPHFHEKVSQPVFKNSFLVDFEWVDCCASLILAGFSLS